MRRTGRQLSAGEWALLALLDERPQHAFALARELAPHGEIGRVWSMRRPLVYHALDKLERLGLVRRAQTVPSDTGPSRTILEATQSGRDALAAWLEQPVSHVRDARSMLMLKLLFLERRGLDPTTLLSAQRRRFATQASSLEAAIARSSGFERDLLLWRLGATTAAIDWLDGFLARLPVFAQR